MQAFRSNSRQQEEFCVTLGVILVQVSAGFDLNKLELTKLTMAKILSTSSVTVTLACSNEIASVPTSAFIET